MPTTYAHDLFGKRVYKGMPSEIRKILRKNENLFRIGLHGPDILFYCLTNKKVINVGTRMHREPAKGFFESRLEMVRRRKNDPLLAYLLGFGCHFLLDSLCHPYVNEKAREGVISHALLEKELDRALMLETGKNPHHFYPSDCIVPKISYGHVIHRALPEISTRKICRSLKMMKFITNCMVYDNAGKRRRMIRLFTIFVGKKRSDHVLDYFMAKEPVPGCESSVRELRKLYDQALQEAPEYLEELYALSREPGKLSERWERTYNG